MHGLIQRRILYLQQEIEKDPETAMKKSVTSSELFKLSLAFDKIVDSKRKTLMLDHFGVRPVQDHHEELEMTLRADREQREQAERNPKQEKDATSPLKTESHKWRVEVVGAESLGEVQIKEMIEKYYDAPKELAKEHGDYISKRQQEEIEEAMLSED